LRKIDEAQRTCSPENSAAANTANVPSFCGLAPFPGTSNWFDRSPLSGAELDLLNAIGLLVLVWTLGSGISILIPSCSSPASRLLLQPSRGQCVVSKTSDVE
jgi:hypothetical protein